MTKEIMDFPAIAGKTNEYEEIAHLWLDTQGYITTTNKWFWVQKDKSTSRGYKDIDLLGINEKETVIVNVTL